MRFQKKSKRNFAFMTIITSLVILASETAFAQTTDLTPIAAALAVGLAGGAAAIGMAMAGSAAIGAIVEKPEVFGKAFLFIVLIEAVAIYGLLVAILLVF